MSLRKLLMAHDPGPVVRTLTPAAFGDGIGFTTAAAGDLFDPPAGANGSMSDTSVGTGDFNMVSSLDFGGGQYALYVGAPIGFTLSGITVDGVYYALSAGFSDATHTYHISATKTGAHFTDGVTVVVDLGEPVSVRVVTAGSLGGGGSYGYLSALLTGDAPVGSLSPAPYTINGATFEGVQVSGDPDGAAIYMNGTPSPEITTVVWDGTSYPLSYVGSESSIRFYSFNHQVPMTDGSTHTVVIS